MGKHLSSNRLNFEILFGIPNARENKMISPILISGGTQSNPFKRFEEVFGKIWDLKNDLAYTQPEI